MKFTKIIILAFVLCVPSLAFPLVRLKSVSQSGQGKQGIIKIEFNGNYDFKKSTLNILEDRAEITLPDSFVIPVRRIYKPSSTTSSVLKMEVNQVPGNSVKLSVFFRVPISTIKNSAKLNGTYNSVNLNYSLEAPVAENKTENSNTEAATEIASQNTSENNKQENTVAANTEQEKKTDTKNDTGSFLDEKKDGKKESSAGFGMAVLRMVGALLIVIGLFLGGVFLFKKYLSGGISLGLKNKKIEAPIKMISTYAIAPGKTLYLVDVMGETLLLSSTKEGMVLISKINSNNRTNDSEYNIADNIDNDNIDDIPEVNIPSPVSTSDIKTKLKERLRSIKGA